MTYDDDPFEDDLDEELDMFVEAQDAVWSEVIAELTAGKKTSHWMWFVFPQLASLGSSPMAQLYGIEDLREAELFLEHDVLRERLITVCRLLLSHKGTKSDAILGKVDAKKLRSSMTLFAAAPNAPSECRDVLVQFFDGKVCPHTAEEIAPS